MSLDAMILTCGYFEHVSFVLGKNLDFAGPVSRMSRFQGPLWRCCASTGLQAYCSVTLSAAGCSKLGTLGQAQAWLDMPATFKRKMSLIATSKVASYTRIAHYIQ